ncbi:2Fe-2S iron-sulfur cluster binding domain-containing protein [Flavobacterium salilacus subsp. salilacus]|uniref:2Fe-2S iron-sulfur cluster-binding protein n=1 Tax=Flavobacterium TaxID=237 RepID=UPI0010751727|nr:MULTISPECIES: 2Fe-2S iron-sulfur cluster-binding protein [Flavobacterium]KAF2518970.1 2Fe-2S iron-sulfur cluster binding domain-containing protein [Flavobacterium salilacus subsp. salilacus]MBE1614868.1 2Fe-2S iron-sulfur cluster binding domain-containing protein [Flavobacterium sp. SaA2.13]
MSTFHPLTIQDVTRETPGAISVAFAIPDHLKDAYKFTAGQYINLKTQYEGQEVRKAYSICSSPNGGELRVAIKATTSGGFSSFANENLAVGDMMEVGTPEGKFTFEPKPERQSNYAAFAAGSGITPILAIIHSVLQGEPKSTFVLVYGNKTPEDTIFHQLLHDMQLEYVGRFFVHFVYSKARAEDALFGRIERSTVNFVIKNKHKEKEFAKFYLCGPEEMIKTVSEVLKESNIPEKDIKFELFSTPIAEKKIEENLDGHTKITVLVDDEEMTFDMSQKMTILDAALKQGIDAPYSCQGGICSSCMARITKGSAEMKKNAILTDGEIAEGLILTCQAHPTSSEIYIDYDDV